MTLRNMAALFALRNGTHLGRFAVVAVFLLSFFVSGAWAICQSADINIPYGNLTGSVSSCPSPSVTKFSMHGGYYTYCSITAISQGGVCNISCSRLSSNPLTNCNTDYTCSPVYNCRSFCYTACEADSLVCINNGNDWTTIPGGTCNGKGCLDCDEKCQCEEQPGMMWNGTECIEDTTLCAEDRATCVRAGGVFNGSTNGGCCRATCDLCGNATLLRWKNLKTAQCCNQGLAPPDSIRDCRIMPSEECGMSISTLTTMTTTDYECQDPNLDAQVKQRFFDQCFEVASSSSESGPGSSSGGGTSSEGGNSSAGEYGDCQECPWLDSILDTLTKTKWNTDDIVTCLTTPNLCAGLSVQFPDSIKTPVFAFDTAFRKYLKPLMDSTLKVDSLQLKALLKLDTNQLKLLKADSASLKNDTVTWTKFDALGNVIDTSVHSQNDTTRKWFKRIADSIGVSTDSLAAHIDSIIRHIPDSVLDSIVKYQQYATDNFDSVLFGKGKGFSLVDSLIDSTVKYFQKNSLDWEKYYSMYGDSTKIIHDELIDLPGRNASAIGSALGYGDTASMNLRGDLNGIKDGIDSLVSLLGDTSGLGGAGGGEGSGPGYDTSGYGSYADSLLDKYAALANSAAGGDWGDSASLETVFAASAADSVDPDSAAQYANISLLDSATALFDRKKDTLYADSDKLAPYYDTLAKEMQIFNFDSVFLQPLREAIPAVNSCPEDCFKGEIRAGVIANAAIPYDYKLCRRWTIFNDQDIFVVIRVILRIITAITCVYIGMWYIANRKI